MYFWTLAEDVTYQIKSIQHGSVSRYGPYENLDLLQFSKTGKAAHFIFTRENALQLVDKPTTTSKKCVTRKTDNDKQLILTDNCTIDRWVYNATSRQLRDMTAPDQGCFSPLDFRNSSPPDLHFTAGLCPCSDRDQIIFEAGKVLKNYQSFSH